MQGKAFEAVQVSRNRLEYSTTGSTAGTGNAGGGNRDSTLLREALDKLVAREGASVLNAYDAMAFLYAGGVAARELTSVYWPHSSMMAYRNRRFRYFVAPEGGRRMTDISRCATSSDTCWACPTSTSAARARRLPRPSHLSVRQTPTRESLGNWDLMSVQVGGGRPRRIEHMVQGEARLADAGHDRSHGETGSRVGSRGEHRPTSVSRSRSAPTAASTSCWRIGSGSASTRVFRAQAC